ncbi:MAG: hypothetical protein DRJ21_02075 [Candidatus Methanomethylicota archaeon]|uniref:Formylmethanofuran dehydrogenase subunit B n=1 Tax=Thermoproteota archaeon TaxID=2056631 RepID=A0A497ETK3_9CREN|nr:MAG: hypothetical protein DRJ21_02075 [Candidatus Verstraetearchaeota archaeon]
MKQLSNITCTGCSLACNDLVIEIEKNKVVKIWGSCSHGTKRLKELPENRVKCSEKDTDNAIEKAIEILSSARKPLIYGFNLSTNKSIEIGLEIASKVNGVFDSEPSICQLHIPIAKEFKIKNLRFEEILEKSDFIIYLFVNLADTHLRHASKYAVFPRGEYVKSGRESRIVLSIGYRDYETMKISQHNIKVNIGNELELVEKLKNLFINEKVEELKKFNLSAEASMLLLNDYRSSTFISSFIGSHILVNIMANQVYRGIVSLIKEIENSGKISTLIPLAEELNSMGAAIIPYNKYGFTHAIEFSDGNINYNPSITSGIAKLMRDEVDAALIVGSDPFTHLPLSIASKLKKIPVIYIGVRETLTSKISRVAIPTTITGVESGGKIYRTDGVEVELTPFLEPPSEVMNEEDILSKILRGL